ncbi:AbiTii domain-containing protein [Paracoccus simplex]|uniref:AbiTii domain-containing protein n=1 Tax=Paracoccus simplex TaxID=2086346 RepID=A0ABV7RZC9_9RHOB
MGLLRDLQKSLMNGEDIGPILLKLRYLASRLGSDPLAEWVKYESEGYPNSAEIPDYRVIGVSYQGTFSGPFGSGIRSC